MSVLVVRPRASGGLAAHVDQELSVLRARGTDVREAGTDIQERPHPLRDARTVRALRSEIGQHQPVALHAHGLRAGALAALALPRRRRPRLVVTLHNRTVGGGLVRGIGVVLLRIIARRADAVLAVSPDLADAARRAGAQDVRHAIVPAPEAPPHGPAGVTAAASLDAADRADPALRVLVVARLAVQKGLEDLLDAAELVREGGRDRPVRIQVAGDGPLREHLAARISAQRLPVELLGWRSDVPALLAEADLVVSAAHWEGQPVNLQEALRAGRAIVATDAGGTRWVTGEAARLLPVGEPALLAAAILEHTDAEVRGRAEAASRRRAAQLPDAGDMADQLHQILAPDHPRW